MSMKLNPYEPPPAAKPVPLLWDRAVWAQAAVGLQAAALTACCLVAFYREFFGGPDPELDPRLAATIAAGASMGFAIFTVVVLSKAAWPLQQRMSLIGVDALFAALPIAGGFALS